MRTHRQAADDKVLHLGGVQGLDDGFDAATSMMERGWWNFDGLKASCKN